MAMKRPGFQIARLSLSRSADFPVRSKLESSDGFEQLRESPFISRCCGLESPMPPGFATHHPGGMADNSPTFQRWDLDYSWTQVPKGRLKQCPSSAVPSGLIARSDGVPNVETLGYCRKSLRDTDFPAFRDSCHKSIPCGIGLESPRSEKKCAHSH